MDPHLAHAVRRISPVGDAALIAFAGLLQPRTFEAGEWLLRAGERAQWCHLVQDGLARELYVDADGEEHTRAFAEPGRFTGSLLDLLSDAPSITWIQALEPTRTLAFCWRDFEALTLLQPELNLLARRAAERLYVAKARREHELLALAAGARYARWRSEHPELEKRVSARIVASWLGVTPEHLSRLRRTLPR